MASNKFIALVFLFVSLIVAPISQAQLGKLFGGILGGGSSVLGGIIGGGGSQGGIPAGGFGGNLGEVSNLIHINGTVSCSLGGSTSVVNGVATTPAFSHAQVHLQRGGKVMSSTATDANGGFAITLKPVKNLVSMLDGCKLVVKTPLSSCNAKLPSVGSLVSDLKNVGTEIHGLVRVTKIIPVGFKFLN